ncbi:MAG: phosphoesterase [Proteobacteria bacterium]|nr:MAG: phosphoesterase [Pseudomonadota bacterium]
MQHKTIITASLFTAMMAAGLSAADDEGKHDRDRHEHRHHVATRTPIKHVIVLIGENRTFDHIFATYQPRHHESIQNLLSRGIVNADGSPGPNHDLARQFKVGNINPVAYFVSTDKLTAPNKAAYAPFLPTPEAGGAPPVAVTLAQLQKDPAVAAPPFDANTFSLNELGVITQGLETQDLHLITTGATGLTNCTSDSTEPPSACPEPDNRIANFLSLPNTVFPLTGQSLPYDSYTGDMVHRFFHMWQQSDCDVAHATHANPAGCRNDLYPFVGISRGDDSGSNSMGFYNMQKGDAPLLKRLADKYAMSDNFHQSVMGGTAVQHIMLGTADAIFWEPFGMLPAQPPAKVIADPTPKSASDAGFVIDGRFTKCGDDAQPGITPIKAYLKSLPWRPDLTATTCEPGRYYMINNTRPGFLSNGQINTDGITAGTAMPPSSLRTIGDALNEKKITWGYFGGGYNAATRFDNGSKDPVDVLIGTGGDWYCDICNPFQYSASIMGDPAQRQEHIKDVVDFFDELDHGHLRAVSYVKPDSFDDGHPASSKLDIFEAMTEKILHKLEQHPELFAETAFIITFDEGGGYWDSGFFQPLDFFGDGPRIPLIVVSPFSKGGRISHTYTDHVSIVKFIERNWELKPLTHRSRDNLPNPITPHAGNPYVPVNMPALGDLFDMFEFSHDED